MRWTCRNDEAMFNDVETEGLSMFTLSDIDYAVNG